MENEGRIPSVRDGWIVKTSGKYLLFTLSEPKLIIGHDGNQVWSDGSWVNQGMYSVGSEVQDVPESISNLPEDAPDRVKYTWTQEGGYTVYER